MKKFNTIKRRYKTKKGYVEKEYKYVAKEKNLVTKYNKVNQKTYDKLLSEHYDEFGNKLGDYEEFKFVLDTAIAETQQYNATHKHGKKVLSYSGVKSKLAEDGYSKLLFNAGFNPDDPETWNILGVSKEDFYNQDNWHQGILSIGGITYEVQFNYDDTILKRI